MMSNNEPVSQKKKEPNAFGASMAACCEACMPGEECTPSGAFDKLKSMGAMASSCGCNVTNSAEAEPPRSVMRQRPRKGNSGPRPAGKEE